MKRSSISMFACLAISVTVSTYSYAANQKIYTKAKPTEGENEKEKVKDIEKEKDHDKSHLKKKDKEKEKEKEKEKDDLRPKKFANSHNPKIGVGLELGSNATYGNGLSIHYDPLPYLDIQVGAGYNTTGIKMGAGGAFVLPIGSRFGFDAGGAYAHSNGIQDKITLPADFTPADSTSSEKVNATRTFRVSPANYMSVFAGTFFDVMPMFRILAHVNYNKVQAGNNVDFTGPTEYDQPIDATNETEVQDDFDPKAKSKLDINGIGFSAGVQFRF